MKISKAIVPDRPDACISSRSGLGENTSTGSLASGASLVSIDVVMDLAGASPLAPPGLQSVAVSILDSFASGWLAGVHHGHGPGTPAETNGSLV